ncbi:probable disease resistance RF45 isoform X1 [Olea europaea subsp. europaea]|uniref:Probable disease resistance RF45 isoform X1 n=1 Tax=Olea europaea subsp. europaea TaxID=158383 RepID=A0A8S0VNE0_OLEEU|nr:probable disease resistance RF45 isoform X1 [Olea europaea subsp. europaea]
MAKELIRIYARNKSDVYLREIRTNLIPVIKKRIQDVQARLNLWLPVLKDLDARKNKESRVQNLERDIRDLVFRLQNVLETYSYEVQRSRCRNIIGKFIDDFKSFRIVDLEAKEVNIQITRIIEILSIVLESTKIEEERSHSANENPETETRQELIKSVTDSWENYIVGMDGQITDLKSVLLDGKRGVICIYGKDGMGKTTLAQKLYDSPCVQNHFEIRAWVELGPNIIVRNVLESILKQLPDGVGSMKTSDLTHDTVAEKFVKGKRYLFVLDDIRTLEHWNYFHAIFPNEQNGSKLMLTTQLKEVASSVTQADGLVHKIQTLSPSDSRELFLKTAFLRDPDGKFLFHNISS